jgi:hypothetical protein
MMMVVVVGKLAGLCAAPSVPGVTPRRRSYPSCRGPCGFGAHWSRFGFVCGGCCHQDGYIRKTAALTTATLLERLSRSQHVKSLQHAISQALNKLLTAGKEGGTTGRHAGGGGCSGDLVRRGATSRKEAPRRANGCNGR